MGVESQAGESAGVILLSVCLFIGVMLVGVVVGVEVTGASILGGQRAEDTEPRALAMREEPVVQLASDGDGRAQLDAQAVQAETVVRPVVHVLARRELTIGQFFSELLLGASNGDGDVAIETAPEASALPPGFTLHADGRLEGLAIECGEWRPTFEATRSESVPETFSTTISVSGCANSS